MILIWTDFLFTQSVKPLIWKLDTYAILRQYLFSFEKETILETEMKHLPYHIDFITDYIDIVFKCILSKLFVLILIQN